MDRINNLPVFHTASIIAIAALTACGGASESGFTETVSIDTKGLDTRDAVAQAVAAEYGAPGENEQQRYVLVGENASVELVALLRERGLADVSVGGR